jgi:hypothetical protein
MKVLMKKSLILILLVLHVCAKPNIRYKRSVTDLKVEKKIISSPSLENNQQNLLVTNIETTTLSNIEKVTPTFKNEKKSESPGDDSSGEEEEEEDEEKETFKIALPACLRLITKKESVKN